MKRKKINKAIKTLKKFCESQPANCYRCPFNAVRNNGHICTFENIPICWPTIKDIQKARQ